MAKNSMLLSLWWMQAYNPSTREMEAEDCNSSTARAAQGGPVTNRELEGDISPSDSLLPSIRCFNTA